ncbi:MAG: HD-GYP domain-containing protein [Pseudomonadota bacterium]
MREIIKIKVPVDRVQIGMFVVELDRPWLETDFLLQGFVVQDEQDIDALQKQCDFVYVEESFFKRLELKKLQDSPTKPTKISDTKKARKKASTKPPDPENRIQYKNIKSFKKEFDAAHSVYTNAKNLARDFIKDVRLGGALNLEDAKHAVDGIVDSLLRNHDVLMWLSKLKNKDDYTAEHSLNVCILTATFARHLGHEEDEVRRLALCGLLHDVGKSKIPNNVLNKPGRFTPDEFRLMKRHTILGRELLLSFAKLDPVAADVAYSHHERIDGKGYPRALEDTQISYYAKVVALADTYDAITSHRVYDSGRASMNALDIIYKNRGTQFDESLALEFIRCIGVYPAGSLVEMTNGEIGVVIEENKSSKLKPYVMIVRNQEKQVCEPNTINLMKQPSDQLGETYAIAREVPDGYQGVFLKDFVKKGMGSL